MGKILDAIGSRMPDNSDYNHLPLVAEGTRTLLGEIDTKKLKASKGLGRTAIEVQQDPDPKVDAIPVHRD